MRILAICLLLPIVSPATAQEFQLHAFDRQQLSDVYYAEGIAAGDLNADGTTDLVYGPHWYAGPEFTAKQEIYPAVPQNREGYADNFFNWVYDFDKDGANDILVVGFPGTPAFVYQNPGNDGLTRLWEKHQVADSVGNEARSLQTSLATACQNLSAREKVITASIFPSQQNHLLSGSFSQSLNRLRLIRLVMDWV